MTEIKYWDVSNTRNSGDATKREQTSKVREINETFNNQMYELLMSSSGGDSLLNAFDMDMPEALFDDPKLDGALDSKLSNLKNEGMEKVWAAKMANVLPFSDWDMGYGNDKKNDSGGLSNFIELTVKMQMAKARKNMQRLESVSHQSFNEFIGVEESQPKKEDPETLDSQVQNIRSQMDELAARFDISLEELAQKILLNT